jgi:hypothetical protein
MDPEELEKLADNYGKRGRWSGRGCGPQMFHHGPHMGQPGFYGDESGGMRGGGRGGYNWD